MWFLCWKTKACHSLPLTLVLAVKLVFVPRTDNSSPTHTSHCSSQPNNRWEKNVKPSPTQPRNISAWVQNRLSYLRAPQRCRECFRFSVYLWTNRRVVTCSSISWKLKRKTATLALHDESGPAINLQQIPSQSTESWPVSGSSSPASALDLTAEQFLTSGGHPSEKNVLSMNPTCHLISEAVIKVILRYVSDTLIELRLKGCNEWKCPDTGWWDEKRKISKRRRCVFVWNWFVNSDVNQSLLISTAWTQPP